MSAPKYTPGPWIINGKMLHGWRIDAPGTEHEALNFLAHPVAQVPSDADARLIAAAPELYEALRELLAASCHDCWQADLRGGDCAKTGHARARAAIAKATGGDT